MNLGCQRIDTRHLLIFSNVQIYGNKKCIFNFLLNLAESCGVGDRAIWAVHKRVFFVSQEVTDDCCCK